MCSSHRPEAGADSGLDPLSDDESVENLPDLPRANRSMVEQYVRQALGPSATQKQIDSQVSEVMMADALGRALHSVRADVASPFGGLNRCVRVHPRTEAVEPVPYGWSHEEEGCFCEEAAILLIEVMKAQQAMADVRAASQIVVAGPTNGEMH